MSDRTTDPTLRQLLDAHSVAWFAEYHAPIQGRVQVYSTSPARVDVEPLVILRVQGRDVEKAPILRSVPVIFPGGSTAGYTYPLTPGVDTVALLPQDADIDAYVASGSVGQLPKSRRRFSLSDCIAVPNNLRAPGDPLPATAFAPDGGVLWGLHFLGGSDATDFVAMAQKVYNELGKIANAVNGISGLGHTHGPGTFANSGGPVLGVSDPGPTYLKSAVAATLAKVK